MSNLSFPRQLSPPSPHGCLSAPSPPSIPVVETALPTTWPHPGRLPSSRASNRLHPPPEHALSPPILPSISYNSTYFSGPYTFIACDHLKNKNRNHTVSPVKRGGGGLDGPTKRLGRATPVSSFGRNPPPSSTTPSRLPIRNYFGP